MISEVQILKELFNTTAHTVTVDSIVNNGGNSYTINTCNTYYLKVGNKFTISSVEYTITAITINESITFTGASLPNVTSFEIDPPLFVHGTPKMVNAQLSKVRNKYPFVWLVEMFNTDHDENPAARIKSTPKFNLLFLDEVDKTRWTVDDHYDNVIDAQINESNFFIRTLKKRKDLFETEDLRYESTPHVNFGDYIVNKGYDKKILSDDVSGVQVTLDLPYVVNTCEDGCGTPIISICQPVTIIEDGNFVEYVPAGGTYSYSTSGGGSFTYDLYLDGVDTGQDIVVDGTNITINIS